MRIKTIILCSIMVLGGHLSAFSQDSNWTRPYRLEIFNQNDLRISANNGLTVNRLLHDGFRKGIKPRMGHKTGNIVYGIYSFAATYMTMIWSHELGHSLRADQVGGHFRIHNGRLPIPYTTMHLPQDINYVDEALSVTGGFEVNHLNIRNIQRQFIAQNGIYNEDLSYAFANRLMYTIYTSIIVPVDAEERDVWINTAGDPVHCILPVFKNYSDDKVFMPDSSVNPELVKFYNQSALFGSFFQLLDPQFYREVGAAFGSSAKARRPIILIGDHHNGWTYGTLFNVTPLGYELYMNNYINIKGDQFGLYGRYGRPFKNVGLGMQWFNLLNTAKVSLSAELEWWDQDIFGRGFAAETAASIRLTPKFSLLGSLGYKTEGYVLGKMLDQGFNLGFGLHYYGSY